MKTLYKPIFIALLAIGIAPVLLPLQNKYINMLYTCAYKPLEKAVKYYPKTVGIAILSALVFAQQTYVHSTETTQWSKPKTWNWSLNLFSWNVCTNWYNNIKFTLKGGKVSELDADSLVKLKQECLEYKEYKKKYEHLQNSVDDAVEKINNIKKQ